MRMLSAVLPRRVYMVPGYHGLALGVLAASHYKESFRAPFKGALGAYASFLPYGHPSVRVSPPLPRHRSVMSLPHTVDSASPSLGGKRLILGLHEDIVWSAMRLLFFQRHEQLWRRGCVAEQVDPPRSHGFPPHISRVQGPQGQSTPEHACARFAAGGTRSPCDWRHACSAASQRRSRCAAFRSLVQKGMHL
jgi:hypothetical protein